MNSSSLKFRKNRKGSRKNLFSNARKKKSEKEASPGDKNNHSGGGLSTENTSDNSGLGMNMFESSVEAKDRSFVFEMNESGTKASRVKKSNETKAIQTYTKDSGKKSGGSRLFRMFSSKNFRKSGVKQTPRSNRRTYSRKRGTKAGGRNQRQGSMVEVQGPNPRRVTGRGSHIDLRSRPKGDLSNLPPPQKKRSQESEDFSAPRFPGSPVQRTYKKTNVVSDKRSTKSGSGSKKGSVRSPGNSVDKGKSMTMFELDDENIETLQVDLGFTNGAGGLGYTSPNVQGTIPESSVNCGVNLKITMNFTPEEFAYQSSLQRKKDKKATVVSRVIRKTGISTVSTKQDVSEVDEEFDDDI